jgi:hypothetical protein
MEVKAPGEQEVAKAIKTGGREWENVRGQLKLALAAVRHVPVPPAPEKEELSLLICGAGCCCIGRLPLLAKSMYPT